MKFLLLLIPLLAAYKTAAVIDKGEGGELFAINLFQNLVESKPDENVVYSPASIRSCLGWCLVGASSETADELRRGLKYNDTYNISDIGQSYQRFTRRIHDEQQLHVANRIYVSQDIQLVHEFNLISSKYFEAAAEQVDFSNAAAAVQKINTWVEEQTKQKIKNLLPSDAVSESTTIVLVNAINFKAKWKQPFSVSDTRKATFRNSGKDLVTVDMMTSIDHFLYAHLDDLDALALQLDYQDSEISMLIILPNKIDGLRELERQLVQRDLKALTAGLKRGKISVSLPKFEIEYGLSLKEPLQQLGIKTMFTDAADFSGLVNTTHKHGVSDVRHKTILSVNEAGSEVAAATFEKLQSYSASLLDFVVDHPFVFIIRSPDDVFFAGHVAQL